MLAQRLLEVGRSLVSDLDLESILGQVLEAARDLTGARYAALGVVDESRRELQRFLTVGIASEVGQAIGPPPCGRGVLGELIRNPAPLRLTAVGDHPRSYGFPPGHPPMDSFLGVPIIIQGKAYGNLYLTEKAGGAEFEEADVRAVVMLADWAGVAIRNARRYDGEQQRRLELEHAVSSLQATTAIARALGGETDLDTVLDLIVKRGRALVQARAALILICDGDEIEVRASAGNLSQDLTGWRFPLVGSIAQQVLRQGKSRMIADMKGQIGEDRRALIEELGIETALFVPLEFRGQGLGVLVATDMVADRPDFAGEDELMHGFAASAATAVATAQSVAAERLSQSMDASEKERRRWARELHDETLQDLGALKVMLDSALCEASPDRVELAVADGARELGRVIEGLHDLILELRPATLDELGIEAAVAALVERRRAAADGVEIELDVDLAYERSRTPTRLAADVESAAYRIVQEALTNASKHADATRVRVAIAEDGHRLLIEIHDDGTGFDLNACTNGLGLIGMRERLELIGGALDIESSIGEGTTVKARLPARRA